MGEKHKAFGDALRLHIGKKCNLQNTLFNLSSGEIFIGDFTFFGHNCCVITGTHDITKKDKGRHSYPTTGRDIHIGQGVWVGTNATILGPCTIGDHSVIAAGAVVLPGEYASESMFAGNPAKFKKKIKFNN
jgi:acetyltransferase-like isoleucine patch superfamily enzyme